MTRRAPARPRPPLFDPTASPADKLAYVRTCDPLTWEQYFGVCWGYTAGPPPEVLDAIAERLDVMSGPYEATVVVKRGGDAMPGARRVPGLLSFLLPCEHQNAARWTTLMTRATPLGRRRLVKAHGDTLNAGRMDRFGDMWRATTLALLPTLYGPGTTPMDRDEATAITYLFDHEIACAPDTGEFGEILVDALVTIAHAAPTVRPPSLRSRAAWFTAAPHRLTDAALGRLLAAPTPWLRDWALTALVRDHHRPASPAAPRLPGPTRRAPARRPDGA